MLLQSQLQGEFVMSSHSNSDAMKKENTNNTIYLAPFITVLDIDLEGVLCASIADGSENPDYEDIVGGEEIPF